MKIFILSLAVLISSLSFADFAEDYMQPEGDFTLVDDSAQRALSFNEILDAYTLGGSGNMAAGTCYQFSNCSGLAMHVFNKMNCPVGYRSFVADFISYGCEILY